MGKVPVVTVVCVRLRSVFCPAEEPPQFGDDVERSLEACVKAAKKMLELFEGLSWSGNMARFSFADLQGCSIATIVVLLAGILDRDSGYAGRVAFGMDCLRRMAGGGNATARVGVRCVEALQAITDEARAKLLGVWQGSQTQQPESGSERWEEYSRWAEWLANAEAGGSPSEDDAFSEGSQDLSTAPDTSAVPNIILSSPWEEAAALQLQELSASGFGLPLEDGAAAVNSHDMVPLPSGEGWLPSFAWNDDQMYLMGLTGMDVLDFTGALE